MKIEFLVLIASLLILFLSGFVFHVKNKYYQVGPGEEGLDARSFFFAKTSFLLLPTKPASDRDSLTKSRHLYNQFLSLFQMWDYFRDPSLKHIVYTEVTIPVPNDYDNSDSSMTSIPVRIYNYDKGSDILKPVMLWYHGGGWSKGNMAGDHSLCQKLSKETGMIVVNVDYRLAPEFIFPIPPKDAYSSLNWVLDNIETYGGDATRVVVAGESAGGNLAAVVVSHYLIAKKPKASPFIGLYLVYPALDVAIQPDGPGVEFANANGLLTLSGTARSRYQYSGSSDISLRQNYLFAPILTSDDILAQYPPTVFVVAKYDVLTHESLELADKLSHLNVPNKVLHYETTIHGFFGRELISPAGPIAVKESTKALIDLANL
jgi:acetyl esterase